MTTGVTTYYDDNATMKKVLMVAFHYPPLRGSSGIQRTLKFTRYLPQNGWQPVILTANPRAYPEVGDDQLRDIPPNVLVKRAFALDTARHVALRGSYLKLMALPDRWVSWWLGAVPAGLRLIRKFRPVALWSTYPIATAHLIGLTLHRLTKIPWIADFRDSMTEDNYPLEALTWRSYRWIEKQTIKHGSRFVFTARSTQRMYLQRYSQLRPEQSLVIPNGYDEEDFGAFIVPDLTRNRDGRPLRLLHAGLIYPEERDPRPFFRALARLKKEGRVHTKNLRIDLRASGSEDYYAAILKELEIDDLVHLLPTLPYRCSLQDCAAADALLLFQAASCNHQIPAKVYEYLRLRKPILALTPEEGDTAELLRETGGATIIDLADEQELYVTLPRFFRTVCDGVHSRPASEMVKRYSRASQAGELALCLSSLTGLERI
jgi:glycosyltransferase involved in cell wall biosynthesis